MDTLPQNKRNRLASLSLSFGIIAALVLIFYFIIASLLILTANQPQLHQFLFYIFYFLFAFAFLTPLVAISAGIVALRQIRKYPEGGRGAAITGILLGIVGFVPVILQVWVWLAAS